VSGVQVASKQITMGFQPVENWVHFSNITQNLSSLNDGY
jgi:hypothetical protein